LRARRRPCAPVPIRSPTNDRCRRRSPRLRVETAPPRTGPPARKMTKSNPPPAGRTETGHFTGPPTTAPRRSPASAANPWTRKKCRPHVQAGIRPYRGHFLSGPSEPRAICFSPSRAHVGRYYTHGRGENRAISAAPRLQLRTNRSRVMKTRGRAAPLPPADRSADTVVNDPHAVARHRARDRKFPSASKRAVPRHDLSGRAGGFTGATAPRLVADTTASKLAPTAAVSPHPSPPGRLAAPVASQEQPRPDASLTRPLSKLAPTAAVSHTPRRQVVWPRRWLHRSNRAQTRR